MASTQLPNYMTRTTLSQDLENPTVKAYELNTPITSSAEATDEFPVNSITPIEGAPYQFLENVDRRVSTNGQTFGRKYSQKILSQMPLLFMMPCRPKFMPGYDANDKQGMLNNLVDDAVDFAGQFLQTKIGGQYYSVEFAYNEYYSYLNRMISSVAAYLGLENEKVNLGGIGPGGRQEIRNINWANVNDKNMNNNVFAAEQSIIFFVDSLTSIDTSFSNDTRPSSLAGNVNNYSDIAQEANFLLGGSNDSILSKLKALTTDGIQGATSTIMDALKVDDLAGGIVGSLGNGGVETIMTGGKIIFPDIWADSSHDESYSFTVKLRSPDHDDLSILLNILVPYCKILALTLPKTLHNNPNGYVSPFLVKGYCKGLFSINMGIIDSLQVTKGAECMWNDSGLPTQIDISFGIKNLYNNLAMASYSDDFNNLTNMTNYLFANTSYMDFLANMAGCNVMQQNYSTDKFSMAFYNAKERIDLGNVFDRGANYVRNSITNAIAKIYGF